MLTPLTARVLCGFLLAVGTILLSIARENDRDRVRVVTPTLVLLLPAVALQMARYWDQVDTSSFRLLDDRRLPRPRVRLRPLPGPGLVAGDPRLKALGVAMLVVGYPVALGVLVRLRLGAAGAPAGVVPRPGGGHGPHLGGLAAARAGPSARSSTAPPWSPSPPPGSWTGRAPDRLV